MWEERREERGDERREEERARHRERTHENTRVEGLKTRITGKIDERSGKKGNVTPHRRPIKHQAEAAPYTQRWQMHARCEQPDRKPTPVAHLPLPEASQASRECAKVCANASPVPTSCNQATCLLGHPGFTRDLARSLNLTAQGVPKMDTGPGAAKALPESTATSLPCMSMNVTTPCVSPHPPRATQRTPHWAAPGAWIQKPRLPTWTPRALRSGI